MVYWEFYLDKHLGEYTLGEILFGNFCMLYLGRWEKAFSIQMSINEVSSMLDMHACNQES